MHGPSMRIVMAGALSVLCGCAALGLGARPDVVERFDEQGVSSPSLVVETGSVVQFVNADAQAHEIYSTDCGELSSAVLRPGDTYAVSIGTGPKVCHFQDLLAPLSARYSGTVEVRDQQEQRRRETAD